MGCRICPGLLHPKCVFIHRATAPNPALKSNSKCFTSKPSTYEDQGGARSADFHCQALEVTNGGSVQTISESSWHSEYLKERLHSSIWREPPIMTPKHQHVWRKYPNNNIREPGCLQEMPHTNMSLLSQEGFLPCLLVLCGLCLLWDLDLWGYSESTPHSGRH